MQAEILEGEATESDEEEEEEKTTEKAKPQGFPGLSSSNVVVSGEASETDDEDEDEHSTSEGKISPGRSKEHKWLDKRDKKGPKKFKYDSPFHKKLRERNLEMRTEVVENVVNMYHTAYIKLEGSHYHLNKAQNYATDVSHNVHNLLEDLRLLDTKVENITTAEFLPSFSSHLQEVIEANMQSRSKTPEARGV